MSSSQWNSSTFLGTRPFNNSPLHKRWAAHNGTPPHSTTHPDVSDERFTMELLHIPPPQPCHLDDLPRVPLPPRVPEVHPLKHLLPFSEYKNSQLWWNRNNFTLQFITILQLQTILPGQPLVVVLDLVDAVGEVQPGSRAGQVAHPETRLELEAGEQIDNFIDSHDSIIYNNGNRWKASWQKPPGEKLGYVRLG